MTIPNKEFTRYELIPLLIQAASFEVIFVKKNWQERTMKCVFESTRYIEQGILTVYDLAKEKFRSVNFKTLKQIIIDNEVYQPTFKGKFVCIGNRKEQLLESIQEIVKEDISMLKHWEYENLLDMHDELEQIITEYDLEAVKALFIYAYEQDALGFAMLSDVIQGNLEFIPRVTLKEVASRQLFRTPIYIHECFHSPLFEYQYSVEDLEPYYYETSYGVLQVKEVM